MIERLQRLLGDAGAWEVAQDGEVARELGAARALVAAPRDQEQCAAVLRVAAEARCAVVPWGGGQHQRLGNVPRADLVLVTTGMAGIVTHDAADQTIVAQAGTRLADLVAAVRARGQFLPLDPAGVARATIGGVVAAGVNGPYRSGFGLPRDFLLGARTAHSDGACSRSGGRLVKNVTGFDLHRLYHGSLGTLAVLCEVSLRLLPLPEREATLALGFDDLERLDGFVAAYRASGLAAASYVLVHGPLLAGNGLAGGAADLAQDGMFVVLLRFHGTERGVAESLARTRDLLSRGAPAAACEAPEGAQAPLWMACREAFASVSPDGGGAVLRLSFLPHAGERSVLGGIVDSVAALVAGAGSRAALCAEPGLGVLRILLPEPPGEELLQRLLTFARREDGRLLVVESAPASWRLGRDVFLGALPHESLARALKAALDPAGVLSPGRLYPEEAG
ncbi:MAG: FAD-binding oxidoreductase [Planctomycetes bacterium]|nr:FAD-binding oxidoreductase [Planctomycetota bacterium]